MLKLSILSLPSPPPTRRFSAAPDIEADHDDLHAMLEQGARLAPSDRGKALWRDFL